MYIQVTFFNGIQALRVFDEAGEEVPASQRKSQMLTLRLKPVSLNGVPHGPGVLVLDAVNNRMDKLDGQRILF
jgi:hypothetical protein